MEDNSKKRIIAGSAAYILGMKPKVKISGSPKQLKRFSEVLEASRSLYCALQEGTDSEIKDKLGQKKSSAKEFYQEFGWPWPF
jgi:hypothetical protein